MSSIVIIGGGSLAVEIAEIINDVNQQEASEEKINIIAINDLKNNVRLREISSVIGYKPTVLENIDDCFALGEVKYVIAVGAPNVRSKIMKIVEHAGKELQSIYSPMAFVSKTANIAPGAIVYPFVYIGPYAVVKSNCLLNVGCVLGHDVNIGESCAISPKADLNGYVSLGSECFIGAGAVINPGKAMGRKSKLAAGSILTENAGEGYLLSGNPAKGRQMFRV